MKGARILFLALFCLSAPLSAQEEEEKLDALIDTVVSTCGGDALVKLRNVEIIESYVSPNAGQSWHPEVSDTGRFNFRLVHDLEGGNLYLESGFNYRIGRILTVNERMTLGAGRGRVEIYDVSTNHSASNLLFYVPSAEALFMADHVGSPFAEGVPVANKNTVSMAEALEPLNLNIDRVVTAHNARVYTGRDFEASVRTYRDYDCPGDRPLCSR